MLRTRITVGGIVQGVGFRPFVHRLVSQYGLCGWVRNSSLGVELELEGEEETLRELARRLREEAPPLARVESVRLTPQPGLKHYESFTVEESRAAPAMETLISPDMGICPDCRRELLDAGNRRYRYPFLNCTNCGPRFTIIRSVPYDRARTSMGAFAMCPACEREYRDIADRRYHAEPTCCEYCGPQAFYTEGGETLGRGGDAVSLASETLRKGGILCVKGLGGMHLACLPEEAALLRTRKRRDEKPFALMCRDTASAEALCHISPAERSLLESPRKPIVLLRKRQKDAWREVSENGYLGVMLPYTPLHVLLMETFPALIMTSANLSDRPILRENEEALRELRGVADGFLLHDREILHRCDDSLFFVAEGGEYPVRRSRGYAPEPLRIRTLTRPMLACGAEQKASFALSKPGLAFPGMHIGDLKNAETLEHYEQQIDHFLKLFDIQPERVICDRHPDYLSTHYAEALSRRAGIPLLRVQHHHAHLAACMADNGLTESVIGVIWDGVGYGTDGESWGGEFLTGGYRGFRRAGHIRPLPMPGGDRAVREIWRLGYAACREASFFPERDTEAMERLLQRGLNCPASTGMGRLFDAACAVMGLRQTVSYEGQGAVLLEAAAAEDCRERYDYELGPDRVFDWGPMMAELARDRKRGETAERMAARFMNTLLAMARETVGRIVEESGLTDVALSGGVFQNMYLLSRLTAGLREDGFHVYTHRRVSCNDQGISLGQLLIGEYADVSCGTAEDS